MNIRKLEFEYSSIKSHEENMPLKNNSINEKYDKGYSRVVTENGSYKVSLIKSIFEQPNYNLHPDFQRRITWNNQKRSKLIESLIINIPIPPIFLYEYDYDKYEIMDGLQRISAIISFYNDEFRLSGLSEWSELNGLKYSKLPDKIKEGIDRRQIQVITLLKESAASDQRADTIKRLVFERLNTGGVKLQPQEIRNAILNGPGNKMCIDLSENELFRLLWEIPVSDAILEELDDIDYADYPTITDDEKLIKKLERHTLYKRMYDVELVLRFFAIRYLNEFDGSLSSFLDDALVLLNKYDESQINQLKSLFVDTIQKAYDLFGDKAFKCFDGEKWSSPAKMIYDPMILVLSQEDITVSDRKKEENIRNLEEFYAENTQENNLKFDGKHQSKEDIIERVNLLDDFIRSKCI